MKNVRPTKFTQKVLENCNTNPIAVITTLKRNFCDDLIMYAVNVILQRECAGLKDDSDKLNVASERLQAMLNGQWTRTRQSITDIKKKAIEELLNALPEDLRKAIKEKAGI